MFNYFQLGGLVTESDPFTENNNLFYAQYLADGKPNVYDYHEVMRTRRQKNGLYSRSPIHTKRSVSHDELSAYMAISYMLATTHRYTIWNQIKKHYGAYPAIVIDWTDRLPYNPANMYAWGAYAGSEWSKLFFPFYLTNMIISINKPPSETSSKIIYWLELNSMPPTRLNKFLKSVYEKKMIEQYGENYKMELRKIYFASEKPEFPLFQE